ncbi:MAG: serine/threonine-protein kinase [Pseudomonadota bacterium]
MTSDDLTRLERSFEEAYDLEGQEREDYLARFAQQYPELTDELRALLAAHAGSAMTMADLVDASVDALARDQQDAWKGQKIGVWTISDLLGEGGMGSVFLVERTDGAYHQKAALKLTTSRLLGRDALSRFRAERQILANLAHPNIATLIDGGAHSDGLPYLVMEYIEGERIDVHCDAAALGIEQRLELFLKVCDAVDYAHRNLVVHRDLKPTNILVAPNGEPKLLDFGIAKLLEADAIDVTIMHTREEARAMTPQYASPEQVRGEAVTVGTDVYALGVLLHRLLAGRSPYGAGLKTSREVESAILDSEPTRPSNSVVDVPDDGDAPSAEQIGEQRGLSANELRSRLSGDLDNIVLQCLQKEPERRYASVRDLARDIERYLRDEPVSARGDDFVYRARKFFRRNMRPLIATAAVASGAVALVTFYTIQLAAERDRAELAAARSGQVSSFLTEIFENADPAESQGETVTAIELLDAGAERIEGIEDEAVRAELLRVMGLSYHGLGQFARAEELLRTSLTLLRKPGIGTGVDRARTLSALGYVQQDQYKLAEAVESGQEALQLATAELGSSSAQLPFFMTNLARIRLRNQEPQEALRLFEDAIEVQKRAGTYGDKMTRDTLGAMVIAYGAQGEFDKAVETGREAVRKAEEFDGALNVNTIHAINNLAMSSHDSGRYREAVGLSKEAVERGNKLWRGEHPNLAFFEGALGVHANATGEFSMSQAAFDRARQSAIASSGQESSDYLGHLLWRGRSALQRGDIVAARQLHEEGLDLGERLFGIDGTLTLRHALHLTSALRLSGEIAAAEAQFDVVWQNRDKLRPPKQLLAKRERARLLIERQKYAQAITLLEEALEQEERGLANTSPALIETLTALARAYRVSGDTESALRLASRANAIAASELPRDSWIAAVANAEYGRALLSAGRADEGRATLRGALSNLSGVLPDNNYYVQRARKSLLAAGQ